MDLPNLLFSLISFELFDVPVSQELIEDLNNENINELYKLSKSLDVSHIVGSALNKLNKLDDKTSNCFNGDQFIAMMRYEQTKYEYDKIVNLLTENEIKFIPLKGSVIRSFYKNPYQRTSCDIDILIEKNNIEKVSNLVINNLGYSLKLKTTHDVSFISKSNVVLEVHHTLIEDSVVKNANKVLLNVFNVAKPFDNSKYLLKLPNEIFYYYHILHMAKHFLVGGTGIKPFIDGHIILKNFNLDEQKKVELLKKGGLLEFCNSVELLQEVWFNQKSHTPLTLQMQNYILNGGVYGSIKNNVALRKTTKKSKIGYVFSRIFKPYDELILIYPKLKNRKWLLPFYQVKRWFRIFSHGFIKRSKEELKANSSISKQETTELITMLNNLNLLK